MPPSPPTCPACKTILPSGTTVCPDCGEDLAPLLRLQLAPYVLYNEGLQSAQAGDLDGAIGKLLEAAAGMADDPSAQVVLGKLYAQKGNWAEARRWWGKALERQPDTPEARSGLAALEAREAAAQAQMREEENRQRRRGWLSTAVSFGSGGLLIGIVAVVLSTLRPPPGIAEVSPTALSAIASPTPTTTPSATPTTTPTLEPTAIPTPTPSPVPDLVGPIQVAIQSESTLSGLTILVEQEGNTVRLAGEVPSVGAKYQLEALAKAVAGVALVDVSGLRVVYPLAPVSPTPTTATAAPTPPPPTPGLTPDLVAPLQTAIRSDPRFYGLTIQVEQAGNSVWLAGEVPSVRVKYRLEALTKTIPGVALVDVSGLRAVYVVQADDTLSGIALDMYGRALWWPFIAAENKVADPHRLAPGQTLIIPPPYWTGSGSPP